MVMAKSAAWWRSSWITPSRDCGIRDDSAFCAPAVSAFPKTKPLGFLNAKNAKDAEQTKARF
jgi:hypothetical protein